MRSWTYIIVHHTGAEEKNTAQVRRYHLSLGWLDIGYHYVIERDGTVVPGRSLSLQGAHCTAGGMNARGIGVALLGNLENHPPLASQRISLDALLLELCRRFNIPAQNVLGHREVPGAATACPGRYLDMAVVRSTLAGQLAGQGQEQEQEQKQDAGSEAEAGERGAKESEEKGSVEGEEPDEKNGAGGQGDELPETAGGQPDASSSFWRVQAGAFARKENAGALVKKLKAAGFEAIIVPPSSRD